MRREVRISPHVMSDRPRHSGLDLRRFSDGSDGEATVARSISPVFVRSPPPDASGGPQVRVASPSAPDPRLSRKRLTAPQHQIEF